MKLKIVALLALFGYCLCVPTTEIRGGPDRVMVSAATDCWLRVKLKSCSDMVWLEVFDVQGSQTSRYVKPKDGKEQVVCLPLPCDVRSRVAGKTLLTGDGMGKFSVDVEPDSLDSTFDKLYSEEDQCLAGIKGDDAVVTCHKSSNALLIQELAVGLQQAAEHQPQYNLRTEFHGGTADIQWQNKYDGSLDVKCRDKEAFYKVRSQHDNSKEDRQWEWSCRPASRSALQCKQTDYVNALDQPIFFHCPKNQVLAGVYSEHANKEEDRKWKFQCCGAANHYTRNCYKTDWINDWDGKMDFSVNAPQVFTGVYSYHDNKREDRRWQVAVCDFSYCGQVE